jgi:hypothetical protein
MYLHTTYIFMHVPDGGAHINFGSPQHTILALKTSPEEGIFDTRPCGEIIDIIGRE